VQAVQTFVAASEPTGSAQVRVHDDAGDIVGSKPIGVSGHAHVSEAVRRVPGLEDVGFATRGCDPVDHPHRDRLSRKRVVPVEVLLRHVAGIVERLAVGQGDGRTGRAESREADPAMDVLTEVDDLPVGIEPAYRDRRELLDAPGRRRG
jgi:hypothetical protein